MTPNDLQVVMSIGRIGIAALTARMLSCTALLGILSIAAYVVWRPDWYGVAVLGILAAIVFPLALRAESLRRLELKGDQPPQ